MIEMVIAIGIITVSTLASVSLIVSTIGAGRISQSRVEAANFAREGIETVRAIRDANYLRRAQNELEDEGGNLFPVEWDDSDNPYPLSDISAEAYQPLSSGPVSHFVTSSSQVGLLLTPCDTGGGACNFFLKQTYIQSQSYSVGTNTYKYFVQQAATCPVFKPCTQTKYSRVIDVSKISETISGLTVQYLDVTSTVQWRDRTGTKSLMAQERLYNWR